MAGFRKRFQQIDNPVFNPPMGAQITIEFFKVLAGG